MRGLIILFMALLSNQSMMAKAPDGISGSDIPEMRTGFSLASKPSDTFNRVCRDLVGARFAETIRNADPADVERLTNTVHNFIPPTDLAMAAQEKTENILARIQAEAIQAIKLKLPESLRYVVPEEFIIPSGFIPSDQSPLEMAGCYIRLGNNLRNAGLNALAVNSFLNSGVIYAKGALQLARLVEHITSLPASADALEQDTEQTADFIADLKNNRVDMLVSAAQNYYWAYCNESTQARKNLIKNIVAQYFERANAEAGLLSGDAGTTWLAKIAGERRMFLARS
jgi:hypothetical protein